MTNLASSIIFGIRNGDKTIHDNPARLPVFVGQCTNAVKEVAKYDKGVADALKTINTTSPLLKGLQVGAEFAAKNVNPLICVAGGVKVLTADDKQKELVNQTAALGTMFCAEKSYKALMDWKTVTKAAEKLGQTDRLMKVANSSFVKNIVDKVGDKKLKVILNIAYGIAFVAASITGYNIGEKIAHKINKEENELNNTKKAMKSGYTGPFVIG